MSKLGSEVLEWISEFSSIVAFVSYSSKSSITWIGPGMGTGLGEVSVGEVSERVTGGGITEFTELWVSGILGEVVPFFSGRQVGMGRGGRNSSPGPFEYLEYT